MEERIKAYLFPQSSSTTNNQRLPNITTYPTPFELGCVDYEWNMYVGKKR